jgi:sterol desaturase/sphingolipid hydroxylase (fatty acid hydroxylase superfamily)
MLAMTKILLWAAGACVITDLLGYWLHRLLHRGWIGFLSRDHMKHHLAIYGPLQNQRSEEYKDATNDRLSLGNVGLEWLIPAALLLMSAVTAFHFLHVRLAYQFVFLGASLLWGFLMFSYLHDVMHVEEFWMGKNRWLRRWFTSARTLHDIHHQVINREGLMDKNFGIGLFLFDRLFGTLCQAKQTTDQIAYERALRRFRAILR